MEKFFKCEPILNSKDDLLGIAPFAKHIASCLNSLAKDCSSDSIIIGLYGSWGNGKTSLINIIKEYLLKEISIKKSHKFKFSIKNIIFLILKIFLSYLICDFRIFDYLLNFYYIEKFIDSFSPWIYSLFPIIEIFIKGLLILKIFNFQDLKKFLYKEKFFISNPIILDFAPWNIINEENVLQDFFNLIKNQLRKSNNINRIRKWNFSDIS